MYPLLVAPTVELKPPFDGKREEDLIVQVGGAVTANWIPDTTTFFPLTVTAALIKLTSRTLQSANAGAATAIWMAGTLQAAVRTTVRRLGPRVSLLVRSDILSSPFVALWRRAPSATPRGFGNTNPDLSLVLHPRRNWTDRHTPK